jgi:hypothetical protein
VQACGDSGEGATIGDFKSRVGGIGPQIGVIFPVSEKTQGYANLKAYKEFAAENRAEGWNVWFTVAFSPAPPERPAQETPPLVTK